MKHIKIYLGIIALVSLVAVLCLGTSCVAEPAVAEASDYTLVVSAAASGTGTQSDPFVPSSAIVNDEIRVLSYFRFIDLRLATSDCSGEYFVLTEDVDLGSTTNFKPIGAGSTYSFAGNFSTYANDRCNEIQNLAVSEASNGASGLFASLDGATVGVVYFKDCAASGTVNVGILAAEIKNSTISDVVFESATLSGVSNVGVLCGAATSTAVTGVIIGDCSATVTGGNVGGLIGEASGGTVSGSEAYQTTIVASGDNAGGLIGSADGVVVAGCSVDVTSSVTGDENVGGLVGLFESGEMSRSRTGSAVVGASGVGGIVGGAVMTSDLTVEYCYSISAISKASTGVSFNYFAGLIGYYESVNETEQLNLNYCYFAGSISAPNVSGYGGIFGVTIRSTSPYTQNVSSTSCFYSEEAFGNSNLTSRAFPNPTAVDRSNYKSIAAGKTSSYASYVGWDFDGVWIIDTRSDASGFGKTPDFVSYYPFVTKVKVSSIGSQTAAEILTYTGLTNGAYYNIITGASFSMTFVPPTGYYVATLNVEMGDSEIENTRNLVTGARPDAYFTASSNQLVISTVTDSATVFFEIDSDNYNFIFEFRDYVSGTSGDFRGSTVTTADDAWTPFGSNTYYNSYKFADTFKLKYSSGVVNSIQNVYRLASVNFGGITYDASSLWTSDSTELTGTLVFNVAAMALQSGLTYVKLDETDDDEVASYIFIELVWVARQCTVVKNSPLLDGGSGSSTNFGTVTITGNATEGKYYMGETITFTATPGKNVDGTDGYVFLEWQSNTGNGYTTLADTPSTFSVTLSPDVSVIDITARFRKLWDITVTVTGETGGVRINTNAYSLNLDEYITSTYHISGYGDLLALMSAESDPDERDRLFEEAKAYYTPEHTESSYVVKLPNLVSVTYTMDYLVDTVCTFAYGTSTTSYKYKASAPNVVASGTIIANSGYSSVSVSFVEITYSLTVSAKDSSQGSVYIDGGASNFAKNGVATVVVTAMAHYRFSHWEIVPESGVGQPFNATSSGGRLFDEYMLGVSYTCKITMTSDTVLRAVFVRTYSVTMSVARTSGNISGRVLSADGLTMAETVTFDGISSGASIEFNLRVYEGYVIKSALINTTSVANDFLASGTGNELIGGVQTPYQSFVYTMSGVSADATINVKFAVATYALKVDSSNSAYGSAIGGGNYSYKTTAYVTATPSSGYEFVGWVMDGTPIYETDGSLSASNVYWSKVASTSLIVKKATSLIAVFQRNVQASSIEYSVKVASSTGVSGVGIYVGSQPKKSPSTLTTGTSVNIRASVAAGYTFLGWYPVDYDLSITPAVSRNASYTFVLGENVSLVAVATQDNYTVSIYETNCVITVEGKSPSISSGVKVLECIYGESLTFICSPNTGYAVSGWTKNGVVFATQSVKHSVSITGNLSVGTTMNTVTNSGTSSDTTTAQINVVSSNSGMGYASGGGYIAVGTASVLYAKAVTGYKFLYWTDGDGTILSYDESLSVTSSLDATYVAVFDFDKNSIIKTYNAAGGTVSGADSVAYLADTEITITPERGYKIATVLLNGEYVKLSDEQLNGYSFTLTGTGSNQTITVAFERTGATVLIIGLACAGAVLVILLVAIIVISARKRSAKRI